MSSMTFRRRHWKLTAGYGVLRLHGAIAEPTVVKVHADNLISALATFVACASTFCFTLFKPAYRGVLIYAFQFRLFTLA